MKLAIVFLFLCILAVIEAGKIKCGTPLTNRCAVGVPTATCGILPWCRGHGMRVKVVDTTNCCCYQKGTTDVIVIKGGKVIVQAGDGGDGGDGGRGGYASGIGGKAGSGGAGGDGGEGGNIFINSVGGINLLRDRVEQLEDEDDPLRQNDIVYDETTGLERETVLIIESADVTFEAGDGGEGGDGGAAGLARRGTNGTVGVDGDDGGDGEIIGGSSNKHGGTIIISGKFAQAYLRTLAIDASGKYINPGTVYITAFDGGDAGVAGNGGNTTSILGKSGSGGVGGIGGYGGSLIIHRS